LENEDRMTYDIEEIGSYHAHVYFQMDDSRLTAQSLADEVTANFAARVTPLYDRPVGPHPWPMFEAAFAVEEFPVLVPWLMLNRRGLNILIHPNTADMFADHAIHPIWLGNKLPLLTEGMPRSNGVIE